MYVLILLFLLVSVFPEHAPAILFFSFLLSPLLIVLYFITAVIEKVIKDALDK